MSDDDGSDLCRLCANFADDTNSENLFERRQRKLLRQVEELTGLQLRNTQALPQFICETCQEQTMQAYQFRELCIRVQQHFATAEKEQRNHLEEANIMPETKQVFTSFQHEIVFNTPEEHEPEKMQEQNAEMFEELLIMDESDSNHFAEMRDTVNLEDLPNMEQEINLDADEEKILESTITEGKEYKCELCDASLKSRGSLSQHMLRHANDRQFSCDHCSKTFFTTAEVRRHAFTHTDERRYTCQQCECRFKHRHYLAKHIRRVHSETEKTQTKSKSQNTRVHICDHCGSQFNNRTNFVNHARRHVGDRRYKCEFCAKKFYMKQELQRHTRIHTGEKPYQCKYKSCKRTFISRGVAAKHEQSAHSTTRPFVCVNCGGAFKSAMILRDHMVTHTGERNFECGMCNVSFKLRKTLVQHFRSRLHKTNEKTLQCENK